MLKRKFTKYGMYAIAVLTATLINQLIVSYIKKNIHLNGYLLVIVDMLVVLIIFTPAFSLVSKYTKKISAAYLKTSKKVTHSKNGRLMGILVALAILFAFFALLRHDINVIADIENLAFTK